MEIPKSQNAGLDDENGFAETLITEGQDPEALTDIPGTPVSKAEPDKNRPSWAGKIMGHFKLLRPLGEGVMGLVILAEDTNLKRIVALKVLRKKYATGENGKNAVEQFLREARAAAAIEHPNIVRVYEINQHAGWWYIAMEMVAGNTLREIVRAAGALSVAQACPIIADAAIALQAAHELGIIHRDIKPSNIMVTRNGRGKVSDFGLVRVDDPDDPVDNYEHQSVGTPFYMAPEIIRREAVSPAVDIYSLGATLYYTLTGQPPFGAVKIKELFQQHLHAEPPDLRQTLPGCSEKLALLIQRMLAKSAGDRPNAAEVAAMLRAESISFVGDSLGTGGPGGSTLGTEWQGLLSKSHTAIPDQTGLTGITAVSTWLGSLKTPRTLILLVIMGVLGLGGLGYRWYASRQPVENIQAVDKLFPQAPIHYGVRDSGTVPDPQPIETTPDFSWVGKVDTTGIQYVASKSGRTYYAISDPRALLIRADQFIGYDNANQAVRDGKQPAP